MPEVISRLRRPQVQIGDVFAVPCEESVSFVHLVGTRSWPGAPEVRDAAKYDMYLAVYEGLFRLEDFRNWVPDDTALRAVFVSTPGWPNERWSIVGKRPVTADFPFPANRASTPDGELVVDFSGRKSRPASREEFRRLRSISSTTSGGLDILIRIVNEKEAESGYLNLMESYSLQPSDCLSAFYFD